MIHLSLPSPFSPLFTPSRYKVFYGGRGGAKSWGFARALIALSLQRKLRILCAREFQVSIADSVHRLLCDQIAALGLTSLFTITRAQITSATGSEFLFKGIHHNAQEIKSLEGVDICWVEEAQSVSRESWELLIPTIRKEGSEIWVSFNPGSPDDETWRRFVLAPPENAVVVRVGWEDNPWLPDTLRQEMEYCRLRDPDAFAHVWGGEPRAVSKAQIFRGRFEVVPFETPAKVRFFHGVDWGFAKDPTALVRMFIGPDDLAAPLQQEAEGPAGGAQRLPRQTQATARAAQDARPGVLYIDSEAWGVGVELDELPALFDQVPTSRKWPVKADSSRPETISFMRRKGFNVSAAKKWAGSVEDGIALLKSFPRIRIHPRCVHAADEFRLYSYKVDRVNGDILPIPEDAHNHIIDAARYALDGYVKSAPMRIDPAVLKPRPAPVNPWGGMF